MFKSKSVWKFVFLVVISLSLLGYIIKPTDKFVTFTVNLKKQNLQLFWKNDAGKILGSIENLKTYVESKNLALEFATNAGMYQQDHTPLGLFILNGKTLSPLNTSNAAGNFYLKPNGVFYFSRDKAFISATENFKPDDKIRFATQSGPMLIIDGKIHPAFKQHSTNLNVRNGVGILPDGKVVFAMSKDEINFYDFAKYFKDLGCKNALYLDGFVSRMYLPEKDWVQTDGNFGVMIGVTKK
jgi:uncharacterized protein YigE (DUF2233 family)